MSASKTTNSSPSPPTGSEITISATATAAGLNSPPRQAAPKDGSTQTTEEGKEENDNEGAIKPSSNPTTAPELDRPRLPQAVEQATIQPTEEEEKSYYSYSSSSPPSSPASFRTRTRALDQREADLDKREADLLQEKRDFERKVTEMETFSQVETLLEKEKWVKGQQEASDKRERDTREKEKQVERWERGSMSKVEGRGRVVEARVKDVAKREKDVGKREEDVERQFRVMGRREMEARRRECETLRRESEVRKEIEIRWRELMSIGAIPEVRVSGEEAGVDGGGDLENGTRARRSDPGSVAGDTSTGVRVRSARGGSARGGGIQRDPPIAVEGRDVDVEHPRQQGNQGQEIGILSEDAKRWRMMFVATCFIMGVMVLALTASVAYLGATYKR